MPRARQLLQQGVKAMAAARDALRPTAPQLTVLIYHRVGAGSGLEVDLDTAVFDDQMAELAASGRVRTLADGLAWLGGDRSTDNDPGTPGPVVITFDDGTADFVDHALPVLVRHGVPATLYAATRFIDEQVPFPADGRPLTWRAIGEAAATGLVDIGSHTHGHALLDRLPATDLADELDRSIDLIGTHVGRAPLDFAYPKAVAGSPEADAAVRARFRSAALAGTHGNRPGTTDVHQLARSPIQVGDGMRWFRRKVDGGLALEDDLRRLANRRRYSGATT